ncbi:hypothetical protein [Alteromonas sp. W364]|uniref:hypothetical protein n=1 Tax=Alteromonas sp. W364 TaxID=3075610 RepID=UPI002885E266|nr:hypothetical protein [Alteromonas sp. W364]MDT0629875.1 hypothetical protein [Alteromonas sp. W364]
MIDESGINIFILLGLMFSTVILYQGYLIVAKKCIELAGLKNPEGYIDFEKVVFHMGLARLVTGFLCVAICFSYLFDIFPLKVMFFAMPASILPAVIAIMIINKRYVKLN